MPAKVRQLGTEVHDKAQLPAKARYFMSPALVNPLAKKAEIASMFARVFPILLLIETSYHRHSATRQQLAKHPKPALHCQSKQQPMHARRTTRA